MWGLMTRVKIYIAIILCLFFVASSQAFQQQGAGEPVSGEVQQELGYTATTGGTETNATTSRCSKHTSVGAMTVSFGWAYTKDYQTNDSDTVTLAVYADNAGSQGAQLGGCSSTATITNDAMHFEEVTWSADKPPIAAATVYHVCQYVNGQIGTYYKSGSAGDELYDDDSTCPGALTTTSDRNTTLSVANYDAH